MLTLLCIKFIVFRKNVSGEETRATALQPTGHRVNMTAKHATNEVSEFGHKRNSTSNLSPSRCMMGLSLDDVKKLNVAEPQQAKTDAEMAAQNESDADDERDENESKNTMSMTVDDGYDIQGHVGKPRELVDNTDADVARRTVCTDATGRAKQPIAKRDALKLDLRCLLRDAENVDSSHSKRIQSLSEQLQKVSSTYITSWTVPFVPLMWCQHVQ